MKRLNLVMFKGKKVIIFDMDGTLIDSVGVWNKVDMALIKELGGLDELNELDIQQQRDKKLREYSKNEAKERNVMTIYGSGRSFTLLWAFSTSCLRGWG